jgi:hypothetical protein
MANVQAIHWSNAATVNINVSSSSQSVALGNTGRGYTQIDIMNDGTATVWVNFGDSSVTAALATAKPIGAGANVVCTVGSGETYVAAIAAGSTGKIYFTPGSGL